MAATHVPPELFKMVFTYFLLSTKHIEEHSDYAQRRWVHVNKHELGQLASVSRYWARQTQTKIFDTIDLRSKQDFVDLVTIASSPYSNIASYIRQLRLIYRPPCIPWIHVVSMSLQLKEAARVVAIRDPRDLRSNNRCLRLPNCAPISVYVVGPLAANSLRGSIHVSLPKRVPEFSLQIRKLVIESMQIASLGDLMQIIGELPLMNVFTCDALVWGTRPSAEPDLVALYHGQARRSQSRVQRLIFLAGNCFDTWFTAIALLALHMPYRWRISDDDLNVIIKTVRVVCEMVDLNKDNPPYCSSASECTDLTSAKHRSLTFSSSWRSPINATFTTVTDDTLNDPAYSQYIDQILLDILWNSTITNPDELAFWKTLDDYAASASNFLRYIVIGSKFPAKLARFAKEVEPRMRHLNSSKLGRLRYAIKRGAVWKAWSLGITNNELQTARGVRLLEDLY